MMRTEPEKTLRRADTRGYPAASSRHVEPAREAGAVGAARQLAALAAAVLLLLVTGCSSDQPLATPLGASAVPTAELPTPEPSPTPSPNPTPTPLSPFESDPAVQAFRAYLAASSEAINAKNLQLPSFAALATAERAARHEQLYTEDLGTYYPGPPPAAVLGVRAVSATSRVISICLLDQGFALDKPGGTPTAARNVGPGLVEMALKGTQWKVDRFLRDPKGSCAGVTLPGDGA